MGKRRTFKLTGGLTVPGDGVPTYSTGPSGNQQVAFLTPTKPPPPQFVHDKSPPLPSLLTAIHATGSISEPQSSPPAVSHEQEEAAGQTGATAGGDSDGAVNEATEEQAKVNNTKPPHVTTETFITRWAQRLLDIMRERETDPHIGSPCFECESTERPATYRCSDCIGPPLLCKDCTLRTHRWSPFHRIKFWNGRHFEKVTLASLGFVLRLGHFSKPCPSVRQSQRDTKTSRLTVVHTSGIQEVSVQYCECPNPPAPPQDKPLQLWSIGLWPATYERTRTVFSYDSLHHFYHLSMQSKVSAYDYIGTLRRLTDNASSPEVKDRYREFMTASRQFSYLRLLKWFGLNVMKRLKEGCLALLCPACPQPGINMDPDWESRPPEDWYIDALQYAKDGNFSINQHDKKMDHKDFALTDGAAYYVANEEYNTFLKAVEQIPECEEETGICSDFKAGSTRKYDGKLRSGQMGLNCSRHDMVLPCGTVDLVKGERYANVDYAEISGLRRWMGLKLFVSSYDINCKHGLYWTTRLLEMVKIMGTNFVSLVWPQIRRCVPKFHLPAHTGSCRWLNSFWFMPGGGMTDGESPERRCAHRQDVLNAHYSDFNFQKLLRLARRLAKKLKDALTFSAEKAEELAELEESLRRKGLPLDAWKQQEAEFIKSVIKPDAKSTIKRSPYQPMADTAPTTKQALAELSRGTKRTHDEVENSMLAGYAMLVKDAFDLEDQQEALRTRLKADKRAADADDLGDDPEIEDQRLKLEKKIASWHAAHGCVAGQVLVDLRERFPKIEWPERRPTNPECETLPLPSNLPLVAQRLPEVKYMLDVERKLRAALANDTLREIRHKVGLTAFLWKSTAGQHGQASKTRNSKALKGVHDRIKELRLLYNRTRDKLIVLGEPRDSRNYRPLTEHDCRPMVIEHRQEKAGSSRKPGSSWLGRDDVYVEDMSKWQIEESRILWFRTSALATRWREEVRIVEEEIKRTQRFFHFYYMRWYDLSNCTASSLLERGTAAFAAR
ncbi:hypothetical protein PsYK624_071980 [Phanerochaete sordida]|uniref:CxC2-like cysteine cluster KDZ transposase-associated domain-containing protein n=1 Tax=Phanerochaete sordida TaxID=48140 RepID=A0A9P3GBW8_9APHY|nr:hypothetical protein PsYK624_071980 [Phanerochaete sordida]